MFDLRTFGLTDILECSAQMQRLGADAESMEEAARSLVDFLHSSLVDKTTDEPALALVRLYKTHRFDQLEPDLQAFAQASSPAGKVAPDAPCLTLLASAGDEPQWNDRRQSRGHKAIPLHDPAAVAALPMVSALTSQLGLEERHLVQPDPDLFRSTDGRPGGVFYVAEAQGSEHVPAQHDFVDRYGIRSVVGFGSLLPSGYVFAVVMFTKVPVSRETADSFAALTFAAQLALLPFVERRLFDSDPREVEIDLGRDLRIAEARASALGHLLDVRHHIVTEQATRLELARREAEDRAAALVRSQQRLEASEATKTAILNAALDAIITMDIDGGIVDFNPAAERMFGYRRDDVVGGLLADHVIPARFRGSHRDGLDRYLHTGQGPILDQRIEITGARSDGTEFPVELTVAAVDAGGSLLFSGHVRDITQRVQAETELRDAGERYADIARILQASLLPRELPHLPGVDLAALYRPGQDGLDVGGDFYDVFHIEGDRWGVMLGDVMGKGAEAAATTALARHTLRAAALRTRQPGDALRLLNDALHRDDPDRFCTAAFGFIDIGAPMRLALAVGGHPRPLLRTARSVDALDAGGRLLGPLPEWTGSEIDVEFEPGDLLLLYSDGVSEARRDGDEYGTDRLAQALATTAGLSAADTIAALVRDLEAFAPSTTDDVAVIALRIEPGA